MNNCYNCSKVNPISLRHRKIVTTDARLIECFFYRWSWPPPLDAPPPPPPPLLLLLLLPPPLLPPPPPQAPWGMRQATHNIPNQWLQSAALPPLFTSVLKRTVLSLFTEMFEARLTQGAPPPLQEPRSHATAPLDTRPLFPPLFKIASRSRPS